MATTEPGISPPASPSDVGRHLRAVRKAKGLSRAEVARSAGLTRRELAAYERGRSPVPDSDLWCLAGSCGVDVGELLPPAPRITVGSDLGALTVGESVSRLRSVPGNDGVLREYLAMIYELRNLPPGTKPPVREEDLATLADALGGTPDAIEARLHEMIGASREEAARLRSLILPPRPIEAPAAPGPMAIADLGAAAAMPVPVGAAVGGPGATFVAPAAPMGPSPTEVPAPPVAAIPSPAPPTAFPMAPAAPSPLTTPPGPGSDPAAFAPSTAVPVAPPAADPSAFPAAAPAEPALPSYPPPAFDYATAAPSIGDAAAADRFFAAPQADDPFGPPPPLEALGSPIGAFAPTPDAAFPPPNGFPTPAGPFAPPDVQAFAPPTGPTIDPFAPPSGAPLAAAPAGDPSVVTDPFGAPPATDPTIGAPSAPMRPDGFVADLGTDLPDAVVPAYDETFDAAGAGPMIAPSTRIAPGPTVDPFAGAEMVVLDLGPDGTVVDPHAPRAPFDVDTDGCGDEDPFAILRIPIDEAVPPEETVTVEPSPLTAGGWAEGPADDTFADAFEAAFVAPGDEARAGVAEIAPTAAVAVEADAANVVAPELAPVDAVVPATPVDASEEAGPGILPGDDHPGDDWFDRAAAAADALIAEQRHDGPAPLVGLAATVGDPAAVPGPIAEPAPADAEAVDADTGPPPIAWSLTPPAAAPTIVTTEAPFAAAPAEQFVAASADWQVGGIFPATAMADDGALALRRADVRWALADVTADGDFTIRTTIGFTSGAGFGILFRVSTDESERITGYSFDADPIYSGGGFLLRQWNDSRQHWKPLAHAPVADTARLYGAHVIEVGLRNDALTASIDGETVMHVPHLSRSSIDAGHEPCRGGRIGVQAWSTTEVTVDKLLVAHH